MKLKKLIKRKTEEKRQLNLLTTDQQLKDRYRIEVFNRYEVLNSEEPLHEEEETDRNWRHLQVALKETADEIVPKQERRRRQSWMTEGILDKMDERRRNKERNPQRYEELDLEIRQECNTAKENWINEQCEEVEQLERSHRIESMHKKIKRIGKGRQTRGNIISREGIY